jgi:hypothetical protein
MASPIARGRLNLLGDIAGLLAFTLCASPVFMPLVLFAFGFYRAAAMWLLTLLVIAVGMAIVLRRKISKRRRLA